MSGPQPKTIQLTTQQEGLLAGLCRRQTSPQHQVRRAQIILKAAKEMTNKQIAQELGLARITVRNWRGRWAEAAAELAKTEKQAEDKELAVAIEAVPSDTYRSGTPPTFSAEQVVQIVALACEVPADSQRPVSHWTPRELADEAVKRGIVKSISPQSVERFLKGGRAQATPVALLADEQQRRRPCPEAFDQEAGVVCELYAQAQTLHEQGVRVVSTDEKMGIQALERKHPDLPMKPGHVERREFEYDRRKSL